MDASEYRPGLEGVVAGISAISMVDAERNQLLYRGYEIHDLVENCDFDEVAYLLLHGKLPSTSEYAAFCVRVGEDRTIPGSVLALLAAIPAHTHPMDRLQAATAALATFLPPGEPPVRTAEQLYAKLPTVVCQGWRLSQGQALIEPVPGDGHSANIFRLLTGRVPDAAVLRVFDAIQILYAEHGFNASTFAARVTVSTLADLTNGIVSAIGTLKGPLHGGANEAAMEMLLEIDTPERAAAWVRDALAQKKKIMGFGHREYKNGDERAKIVKALLPQLGGEARWHKIADTIETEMLIAKGLHPNLDFPVARAYYLMGLPIPLYTPLFVLSRITGWSAHIREQLENNRLIRPQHLYNGVRDMRVVHRERRE
jgi:citrate synthase